MKKRIKLQDGVAADTDEIVEARAYNYKLQEIGRKLIGLIYMLVRNVKLHDPGNSIFDKPLDQLKICINTIIASDGSLSLQCAGECFYLNNMLLRLDMKSADNVALLSQEFEKKDVGGFLIEQTITTDELRKFIQIFYVDKQESTKNQGVSSEKLATIKLRRFKKLKELLKMDTKDPNQTKADANLDRKRYGLVVYARIIVFLKKYFLGLAGTRPQIPLVKSNPLIQDLVDICKGHKTNFLGASSRAESEDYLCFHSANVAVLSIVVASELGFSKVKLRELGRAALLHDIGKIDLPQELLVRRKHLTIQDRRTLAKLPLFSVRQLLLNNQLDYQTIQCMLVAYNHSVHYGRPVRDHRNQIHHVVTQADLGIFSKIVSITDCFDDLVSRRLLEPKKALKKMRAELYYRFDPHLLGLFCELMKGYSYRNLGDDGNLEIFQT